MSELPAPAAAYDALRPVHQRFVDRLLAGEKPKDIIRILRPRVKAPQVLAWKWMARPDVRAALAERREQLLESVGITQQMIVRELGRIAFGDPRALYDERGNPKAMHELTEDEAAMIAGIEVEVREDGARVHKLKRWDKRQALRDLAELGGLRSEKDRGESPIFNIQINL
jgi:hypothetical protein